MSSEPERLGWLIKRIQHSHHRALDKNLARIELSLVQWNALREIERNPRCSQHYLAEQTFNSDQAFGTLVNRLEAAGLIERNQGPGRAIFLQLTPKGKALLGDGQVIMSEIASTSFAPLGDRDREELERLLTIVLENQSSH